MPHELSLDDHPMLIARGGRLRWLFANGKTLPDVRGGDDPDPDPKTFTQADVDRIVQDRLSRVKPEPPADYNDLKAKAAKYDQAEAANRTELEAAQATIATVTAERDAAHAERDAAKGDAKDTRLRMAVVAAAAAAKAVNPDQVFALLPKDAVTIGDDGQVTGAEKAVKAFIEANPHFVGSPVRPKPDVAQGQRGDAKGFGSAGLAEARKRFGPPAGQVQQQQQ